MRSELTKLTSLRSVPVLAVVTLLIAAAFGALAGGNGRALLTQGDPMAAAYLRGGLLVIPAGLVVPFCVLGAFAASSEYPGRARLSLLAVPSRPLLLAGKVAALAAVCVPWAVVVVLAACLACEAALGDAGEWAWLSMGQVAGGAAYLTALCLIAFGFALLCRSAIPPLVVMVAMGQVGVALLLNTPARDLAFYLPDLASATAFLDGSLQAHDPAVTPAVAGAVVVAWVAMAIGAGGWRLVRSDA